MAKIKDRQKALKLRQKGMSYSQIKNILHLSKSTLSIWLKDYPLSKERIRQLRDRSETRIEKYRQTMKKKWEKRLNVTYQKEKKKLLPLTEKQLYLAGLFLYWGEGTKALKASVSLNNTDPAVIKFYLYWLVKIIGINKTEIRANLHLYSDMNIGKEIKYWSEILNIAPIQFMKPYIKKSTRSGLDQKGFSHGTCGLTVSNVLLKEKIMMGIRAIADYYCQRI